MNATRAILASVTLAACGPVETFVSTDAGSNQLTILTETLPSGTVGDTYFAELMGAGGSASGYVWSITNNTPPTGLQLDPLGTIRGVPAMAGDYTFTITLQDDAQNTTTKTFSVTVAPASGAPLTIVTETVSTATVGVPYSVRVDASGGSGSVYIWTIRSGALPDGLSLVAADGPTATLSGVPQAPGDFTFEIEVRNDRGEVFARSLTIRVVTASLTIDTQVPSLCVTDGSGIYEWQLTASGGSGQGYTWALASGALPPDLTLSPTGLVRGRPTTFGMFPVDVVVTDGAGTRAQQTIVFDGSCLVEIVTTAVPSGVVQQPYDFTFTARGGQPPYSWQAYDTLPDGLTLEATSGRLFGTPTTDGNYVLAINVVDTVGAEDTVNLLLVIDAANTLRITTLSLPPGQVGVPFNASVQAAGGQPPYTFMLSGGELPPGLGFTSDGTLFGRPTATAMTRFEFDVTVQDNLGATASRRLVINIP